MANYSQKLPVSVSEASDEVPRKLAALFLLSPPPPDAEGCEVTVEALSQRDACVEIIRHSLQLDVTDHSQGAHILEQASRVARQVPVFTLTYPRGYSCLPAVPKSILE
jgi:hypothetical protein